MIKNHINTKYVIAFIMGLLIAASFTVFAATTRDTSEQRRGEIERYDHFTVLNATTTQATSTALEIAHAEKVQVYFTRNDGDGASGNGTSTFYIQISPDGTDWYFFNKIISNLTNTNSQELTRVGSVTLGTATSTTMATLDIEQDAFHSVRCVSEFASTTTNTVDSNTCEISVRE